ncbi:RNA polymerase sigma factor [Chitinophaga sp.]|uniref:RNA polymerase sigma factor n=1 Tax=Chitinophaga sp. TaxID=1869181 RepID=UPI002F937E5B
MRGANFHIEKDVLIRISEGDEDAFRQLFYGVLPWLTPFIGSMVKTGEGTQEIVQETFIRIWLSRDKLPALQEPKAWIIRVATNECFTYFHKQTYRRKINQVLEGATAMDANVGEDRLQMKETQLLIQRAVNTLPPQRKKIYQMSREQGLKTPEIADQLQCSHSYVKNTLTAALSHIREYLTAAGKIIPLLILFSLNS